MSNKKLNQIFEFCDESGIEIVSFGLAPNPNGFCFERGDDSSNSDCARMNDLLESLSPSDERALRREIFGIIKTYDGGER